MSWSAVVKHWGASGGQGALKAPVHSQQSPVAAFGTTHVMSSSPHTQATRCRNEIVAQRDARITSSHSAPRFWTFLRNSVGGVNAKRSRRRPPPGSVRRRQPEQRPQLRCRHFAAKLFADRQVKLMCV